MSKTPLWFQKPAILNGLEWRTTPTGDLIITTQIETNEREGLRHKMQITHCKSLHEHRELVSFKVTPFFPVPMAFTPAQDGPPHTVQLENPSPCWLTEEQAKSLVQRQDGEWQ